MIEALRCAIGVERQGGARVEQELSRGREEPPLAAEEIVFFVGGGVEQAVDARKLELHHAARRCATPVGVVGGGVRRRTHGQGRHEAHGGLARDHRARERVAGGRALRSDDHLVDATQPSADRHHRLLVHHAGAFDRGHVVGELLRRGSKRLVERAPVHVGTLLRSEPLDELTEPFGVEIGLDAESREHRAQEAGERRVNVARVERDPLDALGERLELRRHPSTAAHAASERCLSAPSSSS